MSCKLSSRGNKVYNTSKQGPTTSAKVKLDIYPHYLLLEIWVVAQNDLGTEESVHLIKDAKNFGE